MKKVNSPIQVLLALALTATVAANHIHSDPVVRTTSGTLIGQTVTLDTAALVHRFLGVPFAQAPIGEKRFEKPQPLVNQTDSLLLTQETKPTCIQMHHLSKAISPLLDVDQDHNISEDCLYLNIYVPAGQEQSHLPIMVWLPGEGFDFADARQFNGAYLASMGQVIVITVQYRVGVFGFLKNNAGLWDQLAALEWIQENARRLGGEPENVTLFGRFTGSMSISMLLSSPVVIASDRPLFSRAILMSGIAVGNWVFDKRHDDKVTQLLGDAHCDSLSCLRSLSAEKLLAASGYAWKPVIDGQLLVEEPLAALRQGHFPKYVANVMLGTNQFEGNLCLLKHMVVDEALYSKLIVNNVSTSEYAKAIHEDLEMFHGKDDVPEIKSLLTEFSRGGIVKDRSMYVEFCAELLINSHMRQYGELLQRIVRNGSYNLEDVTDYKLDYKPSFSIAPEFINSSIHGDDVILAFGLAYKSLSQATEMDKDISRRLVALFANFALSGEILGNHKSIVIRAEAGACPWRLTKSQAIAFVVPICCLFFAVCLLKMLLQFLRSRPSNYVKQFLQNPSEIY